MNNRLPDALAAAIAGIPERLGFLDEAYPCCEDWWPLTMASAFFAKAVSAAGSVASSFTAVMFGPLVIFSGWRAAAVT